MHLNKHSIKHIFFLLVFFLALFISSKSEAQVRRAPVKTRILFIFDQSNSMMANWESGKKIDVAKNVLYKMVDSLSKIENVELALRMYGHQSPVPPQDCSDTKLEVPFGPNNAERIKAKLRSTRPKGTTPIARSLEECGDDFPNCTNCRNIIILITDGIEACGGDPCKIAITLQNKGITIKPFIIGIGLDVKFKEAFECIGDFYNATDEGQFKIIMKEVVHKSLNGTTAEIDLLDSQNNPTETDVPITLFNEKTGEIYRNFVHTMNFRGNPDTLSLPVSITYKMKVHTIPPVIKENIELKEGVHNKIKVKTPQGYLNILHHNGTELKGTKCIIRKHGTMQTINIHEMFETVKYITGKYDIEILSLPRTYLSGIEISQSKTKTVKIDQPGLANIYIPSKGIAGIYKVKKDNVVLVKNINNILRTSVYLQPGHYMIIYRPANVDMTSLSKERHFIIKSGHSVNVNVD